MEISIIIPVYQVEKYIKNCILSIIRQSFKNFEVILVNDGTRDNSIEIAEKILKSNQIVYKVINQKNKGVSVARNKGILCATGKWIICIDSDDIINEKFLEILYKGIKDTNYNISIVNYRYVNEKNLFLESNKIYKSQKVENILNSYLKRNIKIISPAILIRKEFILKNNLLYNEKAKFSEDMLYIYKILLTEKTIIYNKSQLYNYYIRQNSTMTSSSKEKIMTGYYEFIKFTNNINNKEIMARWILGALHTSAKIMNYDNFKDIALEMNYRNYVEELGNIKDWKCIVMSFILKNNLKLFYFLIKNI